MSLRRGLLICLRQVDPSGLALTHSVRLCGIASLDNSDLWEPVTSSLQLGFTLNLSLKSTAYGAQVRAAEQDQERPWPSVVPQVYIPLWPQSAQTSQVSALSRS